MSYYLLELFSAVFFFSLPLEKKISRRAYYLLGAGIMAVLLLCCMVEEPVAGNSWTGNLLASVFTIGAVYLVIFAVIIGGLLLVLKVSFREALYCFCCAYWMEHAAYCVRSLLEELTRSDWFSGGHPLYYLVMSAVYFLIWLLFVRKMVEDGHYATNAQMSVDITLTTLAVTLVLSITASALDFTAIHAVYALIVCFLVLADQVRTQKQLRDQADLALQRELWVKNKNQYENAKDTIDIINRKSHDLKHQISAIRSMSDEGEKDKVLADMEHSVFVYDSWIKTGNEILDTVLTEKSLVCNDNGIELNCIADGKLVSFMNTIDLYTLFGNALDNAIEAQMKMPEGQRRIDLRVVKRAGLVLVQIRNRYEGEVVLENGVPKTSKQEKHDHGYGVSSMFLIAEKYGGFGTLSTENGVFTLRLTFPAQQNTDEK